MEKKRIRKHSLVFKISVESEKWWVQHTCLQSIIWHLKKTIRHRLEDMLEEYEHTYSTSVDWEKAGILICSTISVLISENSRRPKCCNREGVHWLDKCSDWLKLDVKGKSWYCQRLAFLEVFQKEAWNRLKHANLRKAATPITVEADIIHYWSDSEGIPCSGVRSNVIHPLHQRIGSIGRSPIIAKVVNLKRHRWRKRKLRLAAAVSYLK